MSLTTIINLVLIVIIVVCAWQGFKKGIIMGIIGVLVIILSLYGARLLSDTFSYEIIPVMKPFVSGFIDTRVEDTGYAVLGYEPDENGVYDVTQSLADMLKSLPESRREIARWTYHDLGFYDSFAEDLADRTIAYSDQNNLDISTSITYMLCQTVSWYGGFLLGFILLFTAMTVIVNLPNLSFKLPYLGIINDLGGLAIGIFTGLIFCSLLLWLMQFAGALLPEDTLREARIAAWFLDENILTNYITL